MSNSILSGEQWQFYVLTVGKLVEQQQREQTGLSEKKILQTLDIALTPSVAHLTYRQWSPEYRQDISRAFEAKFPEGDLLNIMSRAYTAAERRLELLQPVSPLEQQPALPLAPTPETATPKPTAVGPFFAGSAITFALAVALGAVLLWSGVIRIAS